MEKIVMKGFLSQKVYLPAIEIKAVSKYNITLTQKILSSSIMLMWQLRRQKRMELAGQKFTRIDCYHMQITDVGYLIDRRGNQMAYIGGGPVKGHVCNITSLLPKHRAFGNFEEKGHEIKYKSKLDDIIAFVDSSYACKQFTRIDCYHMQITDVGYLIDRRGNQMAYIGGGPVKGHEGLLACDRDKSCEQVQYNIDTKYFKLVDNVDVAAKTAKTNGIIWRKVSDQGPAGSNKGASSKGPFGSCKEALSTGTTEGKFMLKLDNSTTITNVTCIRKDGAIYASFGHDSEQRIRVKGYGTEASYR
eukprot:gene7004-12629_t